MASVTGVAYRLENKGARYMYELNSRWAIDGSSRRNLGRYANHSCRPNAESDVIRGKKIIIRAIRNIQPGDEITYDYGRDYFRNVLMEIGDQSVLVRGQGSGVGDQAEERQGTRDKRQGPEKDRAEGKLED
mgnify:CR=1 FL=1